MGFYSVWPYFAGMVVILLLASTPLLTWADTPPKTVPGRIRTIDGLRGFLALGVVFHHAAIYHQYLQTGEWSSPPALFYANIGAIGVAMFFMITGYLFWTQMLKTKGKPNLSKLYVGRVFRIVPLYLFLVVVVMLTVGVMTQWDLKEPPLMLVEEVARWLAGGAVAVGDVNGYAGTGLISANVTWTLHYEWEFYASLLVTSFFARSFLLGTLLPVAGLLVAGLLFEFRPDHMSSAAALMFSIGMAAASAKNALASKPRKIPQWMLSTGVIGCLALVLLFDNNIYSMPSILILGVAFALLVVFDATLFGVLLTRPARRLGDISYGIYLLQGPIFFLMFAPPAVRSFAIETAWVHWTVVMVAALALVVLATVTHALIERPGIQAGYWIWASIASMRHRTAVSTADDTQRRPSNVSRI